MKHVILSALAVTVVLAATGCSDDKSSPAAPKSTSDVTTFANDLDGWTANTSSVDWGSAVWSSLNGGCVKLDGVGNNDPEPNAWIEKQVTLPASVTTLHYKASAHDRGVGTGSLRVRLKDEGDALHTLVDWETFATGDEGLEFFARSASLSAYAGQTVTLYFELDDLDGGGNNQVYVDDIEIRRSN
jgi:hypothetical protein